MLIKKYAAAVAETNKLMANSRGIAVRRYGLFGQVGGLLELVKKEIREEPFANRQAMLQEEIGDILWYTFALVAELKLDAVSIFREATRDVAGVDTSSIESFKEIDQCCEYGDPDKFGDALLHGLGCWAGTLLAQNPKTPNDFDELKAFVDVLIRAASHFEVSLAEAARFNVWKTKDRWPGENPDYGERLDASAEPFERFPTELVFDFVERTTDAGTFVYLQINGINIGDRLTDNRQVADGYRFHDVFHLAYAVHLGWSPMLRALLKLKRKHQPEVDQNQDGARAIIIEEGIATWIFNHAARAENEYYKNVAIGKLPYRFLKQVSTMTSGYEVQERPMWQWERAILDGFRVFRELVEHSGGRVIAKFDTHELIYESVGRAT